MTLTPAVLSNQAIAHSGALELNYKSRFELKCPKVTPSLLKRMTESAG